MFKAYEDPGHAWVAVKVALLEDLGIADKITNFSYINGKTAYLEEDCDLSLFALAYKEKFGRLPDIKVKFTNKSSRVRSYARYRYLPG